MVGAFIQQTATVCKKSNLFSYLEKINISEVILSIKNIIRFFGFQKIWHVAIKGIYMYIDNLHLFLQLWDYEIKKYLKMFSIARKIMI